MKDRKTIKLGMMWLLLSVLLGISMVFVQTPARAAVTCPTTSTADSDGDGFTDAEECNGITLADGSHFKGFMEGGDCLDPNKKDLFVIWIPATSSNLPAGEDPLQLLKTLPINVHRINPSQATSNTDYTQDRIVSPLSTYKQKAVRVTESLDTTTDPDIMGNSYEGIPGSRDGAVAFTERIKKHILAVGACTDLNSCIICCDDSAVPVCGQGLFYKYIKQTIAHEIGHMIRPLAPVDARDQQNFGGYHYKSGTNVILDQSVYYAKSKGIWIFHIGTTYTPADIAAITLR